MACPPSKNWEYGIGELAYSVDVWFLLRQYTSCHPRRVSWVSRPVRIGTGGKTTSPSRWTQSSCRSMSTQVTR